MNVLVTGGTGFVGRHLAASLLAGGHEVTVLSRGATAHELPAGVRVVQWDPLSVDGEWPALIAAADGVVNLAGASIGSGRWTRRRTEEILSSRLRATGALVKAITQAPAGNRPKVLVSASGIDYYGDRGEETVDEESGPGNSFLAGVCQQWEAAARGAESLGVRVVLMRTALAFSREAPSFRLMVLPFRLFAGGPLGSGSQWFTWVHVEDLVGLYRLALENQSVSGPLNAVAPDLRRQREVAVEIGRAMHRPSLMPAPAPLLRLALGRQSDLLLQGRRATSRAAQLGYRFRLGDLPGALKNSL
jgi:uncharacterized protein (TIGR01777 family)